MGGPNLCAGRAVSQKTLQSRDSTVRRKRPVVKSRESLSRWRGVVCDTEQSLTGLSRGSVPSWECSTEEPRESPR